MENLKKKPNPKALAWPQNESQEHYFLKQVAKAYLKFNFNCKYVGSEVYIGKSIDYSLKDRYPNVPFNSREITDVVGIENKKLKHMSHKGTVRNIEVKVSRADFLSGYSTMGDYNYIIAPKGVLERIDIPKMIGFIEVDFDKLGLVEKRSGMHIEGLELVKRPYRIKQKKYIANGHKGFVDFVLRNMLSKHTINDTYKNLWFY